VAFYEANGMTNDNVGNIYEMFIYGSEFKKGTTGMVGSLEADDEIFENSPIILKDKYAVSGSDMAQIGWVEVTTEKVRQDTMVLEVRARDRLVLMII
jgi:hypothetical protein